MSANGGASLAQELSAVVSAFERGWLELLRDERITAGNVDSIAGTLLKGIIKAAELGEKNEMVLVAAGIDLVNHEESERRNQAVVIPQFPSLH